MNLKLNYKKILLFHDFPLQMLYNDDEGNFYFLSWLDDCGTTEEVLINSRYLCMKTEGSLFDDFINNKVGFLEFLKSAPPENYFLFNAKDGHDNFILVEPCRFEDYPQDAFPTELGLLYFGEPLL